MITSKMSATRERAEEAAHKGPEEPNVAYLVNADGLMLYCERWAPENQPRALICLCHGFAEHIGYYKELAQELIRHSLYVFAHDHVGHGRSEGTRVYIENFNDYVRDVFQHIELIKTKYPALPVLIVGHSMGGTIAIKAAMQRPEFFQGVVLVGPAVTPNPDMATPLKVFMAKALSRIIPKFPIAFLGENDITRDQTMLEFMKKDNLRHHGAANAKWAACMIETLQDIRNNLSSINWPFLVMHGDKDNIIDVNGSKTLHSLATSNDKEIKIYKDAFHNLICEVPDIRRKTYSDICDWILPRLDEHHRVNQKKNDPTKL